VGAPVLQSQLQWKSLLTPGLAADLARSSVRASDRYTTEGHLHAQEFPAACYGGAKVEGVSAPGTKGKGRTWKGSGARRQGTGAAPLRCWKLRCEEASVRRVG